MKEVDCAAGNGGSQFRHPVLATSDLMKLHERSLQSAPTPTTYPFYYLNKRDLQNERP